MKLGHEGSKGQENLVKSETDFVNSYEWLYKALELCAESFSALLDSDQSILSKS